MTFQEYLDIEALNASRGKLLLRSADHFKNTEDQPDTEAQSVGTLVHAMAIENKDLRDTFAIKPEGMKFNTKEGKKWRDAQTLPILESESARKVPLMADAILNHPQAYALIKSAYKREHVIVRDLRGVKCKARVDMVARDDRNRVGVIDIKTTRDARPEAFAKRAADEDFCFDMQICLYRQLVALEEETDLPWCAWIAVENQAPPFGVNVFYPDDDFIQSGNERLSAVLSLYKTCTETGLWPGYAHGVKCLALPKWRRYQLNGDV